MEWLYEDISEKENSDFSKFELLTNPPTDLLFPLDIFKYEAMTYIRRAIKICNKNSF